MLIGAICSCLLFFITQYLRRLGPRSHFFSSDFTDRHKAGLCCLIRAAFHAHARLAPVSRGAFGCSSSDEDNAGASQQTRQWLLQRDDPEWWWWHSYFAPRTAFFQTSEIAPFINLVYLFNLLTQPLSFPDSQSCSHHSHTSKASHLAENVMRVAVTQDAIRLWRLLLPDSSSLRDKKPAASSSTADYPTSPSASTSSASEIPPSPDALGVPASLLWEVTEIITFFCCFHHEWLSTLNVKR